MRIGIITFHFAFNQGAALQCYAMQKFLESRGHEAYVIDYRPRYHTIMHSAWRNPFVYSHVFWKKLKNHSPYARLYLTVRSFIRCMCWNLTGVDKKNQEAFHQFEKKHFHLTREYRNLHQLQSMPPEMDAYISGSDQVWNPDLLGQEFDRAYFLDFGAERTRRVAYAVSMGKGHDSVTLSQLQGLCKGLHAISLREFNKADIEATGRDVHICIDPTFLLDAEDYSAVEGTNVEEEPYIFVYGFETNDLLRKAIEAATTKYRCRIINGSPKWLHLNGNVQTISGYGPDQFLSLVKNAKCIITNSFHGTAFSIIYKKDFITVPHLTRGKRMEDLLSKLGISFRLFGDPTFSFDTRIDYSAVYEKVRILRAHSIEYLDMAISGSDGEFIPHYLEDEAEYDGKKASSDTVVDAFYGYYEDEVQLRASASGGAATALSEMFLREYGVVVGVAYSSNYRTAEFRCIETMEELNLLKGSKYIPPKVKADGKLIFDVVGEKLQQNKKVLFIGSGCHIGALLNRLKNKNIDTANLYTIDLICHGPTIQAVYDAFIKSLEDKFQSPVVEVNMRHKKRGWVPPYFQAKFENGKQYSKPLYETDFGFALRVCVQESCYQCKFKDQGHVADITIGDFWGLKPGMKEYNKNGVSAMITRSSKGKQLIDLLGRNNFYVEKTNVSRITMHNRMYSTSLKKPEYIERFKSELQAKGLHYATIHSKGYPAYVKLAIRNRIKTMLGMR